MRSEKPLRLMGIALAGLATAILSTPAFPQNCALCYTQAASSGARMIEALRSGILVLIIPPTLMWLVIAAILYIKRNRFKQTDQTARSCSDW